MAQLSGLAMSVYACHVRKGFVEHCLASGQTYYLGRRLVRWHVRLAIARHEEPRKVAVGVNLYMIESCVVVDQERQAGYKCVGDLSSSQAQSSYLHYRFLCDTDDHAVS
jgi:hypothetical protein